MNLNGITSGSIILLVKIILDNRYASTQSATYIECYRTT